jgi:hypothetical protein
MTIEDFQWLASEGVQAVEIDERAMEELTNNVNEAVVWPLSPGGRILRLYGVRISLAQKP